MPKFLENILKKEYGKDSSIPYKVMNKLGVMKGNKETTKGKREEKEHITKTKAIESMRHGAKRVGMRVKGSDRMTYLGK
jgi:hypothetical protein